MKLYNAFLVFALMLSASPITACDCNVYLGFKEAAFVFVGKVISIENNKEYEIGFQLIKIEKGKYQAKEILVYTTCLLDACCGYNFEIGGVYKVYTNAEFRTGLCTENWKLDKLEVQDIILKKYRKLDSHCREHKSVIRRAW